MAIAPVILRALADAGASTEMIIAALEADQKQADERLAEKRAKDAARKRAQREREKTSLMSRGQGVTPADSAASTGQRNVPPDPPKETPSSLRSDGADARQVRDELRAVLDAEHTEALIEHRRRMGKKLALTPYAAKQLAKRLGAWHDPNEAADAMIANGWQGFEPKYLANRGTGPPQNGSHPRPLSTAEQAIHELRKYSDTPEPPRRSEADFGTGTTLETRDFRRIG